MTDDLVKRLRSDLPDKKVESHWITDYTAVEMQNREAADRIEALTAEVERLNEALRVCVMEAADWARQAGEAKGKLEGSEMPGIVDGWKAENQELRSEIARLRAALGDTQ